MWVLLAIVYTASIVEQRFSRDLGCEYRAGDSIYGEARWSNWPVGRVCEFRPPAVAVPETQGPGWETSIVLVMLASSGLLFVAYRLSRSGGVRRSTSAV